eukprot:TRINITY_DN18408_c0_g2_i2.p1 TRINITY_DN18408_c0_g2~~TRINITY_DN18408_c0_g2_i2.p1  ORF type:complete len:1336 (-),score=224.67 TRINITY_DN18408_c0_g2_i2:24-4031(-)
MGCCLAASTQQKHDEDPCTTAETVGSDQLPIPPGDDALAEKHADSSAQSCAREDEPVIRLNEFAGDVPSSSPEPEFKEFVSLEDPVAGNNVISCSDSFEDRNEPSVPAFVNHEDELATEESLDLPIYVITWGANDCGQCMLGAEAPARCLQPSAIRSLERRRINHIFAGFDYSCVVTETQRLLAAGSNAGRFLSDEPQHQVAAPKQQQMEPVSPSNMALADACLPEAQHVGFDELENDRFVAVSGGRDHVVAITDKGTAVSWGRSNEFGQLGHGRIGTLDFSRPAVVAGLPVLYRVVAVACGESNSIALVSSGEIYTWGANNVGQLGVGDTEARSAPVRLSGVAAGVPFRAVAAGFQHSLGLSRSGQVYAWGNGRHGRLGLGDSVVAAGCEPSPQLVHSLPYIRRVSAGGAHSAVLDDKGRLRTAGDNRRGQLGLCCQSVSNSSRFCEVLGVSEPLRLVECGGNHTLCLTLANQLIGFGSNAQGQLGIGTPSEFEDRPVHLTIDKCMENSIWIYGVAVKHDHSLILATSAPEHWREEQLMHALDVEGSNILTRRQAAPKLNEKADKSAQEWDLDFHDEEVRHPGTGAHGGALVSRPSFVKYRWPAKSSMADQAEAVLLKPVAQPGVAWKAFVALSCPDLEAMLQSSLESGNWRITARSVGAVLRCPAVLNASFHFPSLREPRLAAEALQDALKLTTEAPAVFWDAALEATGEGLDEYCSSASRNGGRTQEGLRGALVYLMLPQLRKTTGAGAGQRHKILSQVALLVASLAPSERREFLNLLVHDISQASIFRDAVVPVVRSFLNECVKACQARQSFADPSLWNGILLMQLLYQANTVLKQQQKNDVGIHGASSDTIGDRFLRADEFHITALDEETIHPFIAFAQMQQVLNNVSHTSQMPDPEELLFDQRWSYDDKNDALPNEFCVLLLHQNLLPVAFKQKVLKEANGDKQRSIQHDQMGPMQFFGLLTGQDTRPFFALTVRRQHIVDDTVAKLREVEPKQLRFPLKVTFADEDGLDEGGVRREFFQVVMRELFDESYAMFTHNHESHVVWFNSSSAEDQDTDLMYKVCGTVVGLAVYNNEDTIDISFPRAFFKKLKGERLDITDLEDIDPTLWLSLSKMLDWCPSTDQPNEEFENLFCLNFVVSYDYFGELRTFELKPNGASLPVNFENRQEYVDAYCDWVFNKSIERQYRQFSDGFAQVVDSMIWLLLTPEEAHLALCSEVTVDFLELRKGAFYKGGYNDKDTYIEWFWEVLSEFDEAQKKRFLAFVTGCPRSPLGGLKALHMGIQRNLLEPTERLPTSHTCFKLLDLPQYASKEKLKSKLLAAMQYSEGFGLE